MRLRRGRRWWLVRFRSSRCAFRMTRAGPFGKDGGVVGVLVAHDRIELAHDLVAALG